MTGKIEFALGNMSFSGEGSEEWLAGELDKILEAIPKLSELKQMQPDSTPLTGGEEKPKTGDTDVNFNDSLASYIKAKDGDANQVKRFLATADWLRRKGTTELNTALISKSLAQHQQKKLANPADCLNKLVAKGLCEKAPNGFFITPDGLKELGNSG